MALKGLKVIEMAGLAPSPFAGMLLADYGAEVIRIDQLKPLLSTNVLARGKKSISIDLKKPGGVEIVKKIVSDADILIEPFRPGVMEKLGLGPDVLLKHNRKLIYARLSGYGQNGNMSQAAGHDINYVSMTGVLSKLGRANDAPFPPINLLADFAGGSILCVMGILMALHSRAGSGVGQVVDAALTDGAAYASSFLFSSFNQIPMMWPGQRGCNLLDSGCPYYNTYRTKDGRYMAVGALEPQFYAALLQGLDLEKADLPHQMELPKWGELAKAFKDQFANKTQSEWVDIFRDLDACVTPVLTFAEAAEHPHNKERGMFLEVPGGSAEPSPSPKLSAHPANVDLNIPKLGQHTMEILGSLGYDEETTKKLLNDRIISISK
jgi:alpha-methylacyl-CoA racemase